MEQKTVNMMSAALSNIDQQRHEQDLHYLIEEFGNGHSDLVKDVATMLRGGTLRRAINAKTSVAEGFGKALAPTTETIRSLNQSTCKVLLSTFEPDIFTNQFWEQKRLNHHDMQKLICFALNVLLSAKLPVEYTMTKFELGLSKYLRARYVQVGRRLELYDPNDVTSWGYFEINDTMLV